MKENDTFPKWDFRIPKSQISKFLDFGHFESDITDVVEKNMKGNDTLPELDFEV